MPWYLFQLFICLSRTQIPYGVGHVVAFMKYGNAYKLIKYSQARGPMQDLGAGPLWEVVLLRKSCSVNRVMTFLMKIF